jgi:hypothetical protein
MICLFNMVICIAMANYQTVREMIQRVGPVLPPLGSLDDRRWTSGDMIWESMNLRNMIHKWRFPKSWEYPQSIIDHPAIGVPHLRTPPNVHIHVLLHTAKACHPDVLQTLFSSSSPCWDPKGRWERFEANNKPTIWGWLLPSIYHLFRFYL